MLSLLIIIIYWYTKKVHQMQFKLVFESSQYPKQQKCSAQLKQDSQVEDSVIAPHLYLPL